jgi:hypothetical protein
MLPKDTRVGTLDHSVLQEVVLAQASKPSEKRRGSWSFLTWSFFLAQTLAAEKFFGSGARAGENDDAGATRSNDQSKIPSDETASAAAWGPGGQDAGDGRTIDGQTPLNGAQGLLLPGVSQAVSDYSGAGSAGSPNGSGSDGSGGGGGSSSDLGQPLSSLADSEALGDSSAIPPGSEIPTNAPRFHRPGLAGCDPRRIRDERYFEHDDGTGAASAGWGRFVRRCDCLLGGSDVESDRRSLHRRAVHRLRPCAAHKQQPRRGQCDQLPRQRHR